MGNDIKILEPAEFELLIAIRNEVPLPAARVGDLLSALARDYRQMHRGRTLVVSRLQTSSLHIFLRDAYQAVEPYLKNAVEGAKGGKAIFDFAKSIREAMTRKKQLEAVPGSPKSGPHRSIQAMVKVAAETGSELTVRHVAADGSSFEVELTPIQAIAIRERAREAEYQARLEAQEFEPSGRMEALADLRVR